MSVAHTMINGYVPLRSADVTADDTALTLDTAGLNKLCDLTRRDFLELDAAWNAAEIVGWAEAANNNTFAVELYGLGIGPYAHKIGELLADITGAAGTAIADVSNPDNTTRLFLDDVSISAQYHVKAIGVTDQGNNRQAKISLDLVGLWGLYARFYNVGGAGECARINLWLRPY